MHIINYFLKVFKPDNTDIIEPLNRTIADYRQPLPFNLKAIEVKLSHGFRWLWKRSSVWGVLWKERNHHTAHGGKKSGWRTVLLLGQDVYW